MFPASPLVKRLLPFLFSVLLVVLAAAARVWPLHLLGIKQSWLTFYPAVTFAALYGGFLPGIFTGVLSAVAVYYGWPLFSEHPFMTDFADNISLLVFLFNSALITTVAGFANRYALQKKQAYQQLKEANSQLHAINDHLPGSFIYQMKITKNGDIDLRYLSNGIKAYTNLTVQEIQHNPELLVQTIHEDDRAVYTAARAYANEHREKLNIDVRVKRTDGSIAWANIHSIPRLQTDGTVLWDGFFTDISKRKELEQQLRDSEAFLHETGKLTKTGAWLLDACTLDAKWTPEMYRMHEIPEGTKVAMHTSVDLYHPEDMERMERLMRKALVEGEGFRTEARKCTTSGRVFYALVTCHVIIEEGQVKALHGVLQDITERKRLERELEEQQLYNQRFITELVIHGYETEKRKIAFQLHEDINQLLVATKIQMEMAQKTHTSWPAQTDLSTTYLNTAIEKINNLFDMVDAPVFADLGFTQTLQKLIEEYQQRGTMQTEFIYDTHNWNDLSPKLMLLIYRIIQERLHCIATKQKAEHAYVHLKLEGLSIHLTIGFTGAQIIMDDQITNDLRILESRLAFYGGHYSMFLPTEQSRSLEVFLPLYAGLEPLHPN